MTLPAGITATTYPDGRTAYHLGTLFDGATPFHAGPYQASGLSVPAHWWHSKWSYPRAIPAIINSPADIVAANRMFPFGDTGCPIGQIGTLPWPDPMGNCGIKQFMGETGERPEIGLTTDWAAGWMMGGSPNAMLAIAETDASIPWHYWDEKTGKLVSKVQYIQANIYDPKGYQGDPWFARGPVDPANPTSPYMGFGGNWEPESGHMTETTYLAYLATLKPEYLEGLQARANFHMIADSANCTPAHGAVCNTIQTRQIAWTLRDLFMAHIATKDAEARGPLSNPCQPSSYFKQLLDWNLAYFSAQIVEPSRQTFRLLGPDTTWGPWQCDYVLTALALGVLTGHSDWTPIYIWCLGNWIARLNGKSGYAPGWGTGYYLDSADSNQKSWGWPEAFKDLVITKSGFTQAQYDALMASPLNGGESVQGFEYNFTTRAAGVMADYLDKRGLATVRASYTDFDICLTNINQMVRAYGAMNPRVSVISTSVTTQPEGDLMPTTFTIAVGETKQLDLILNGALTDGPIYTMDNPAVVSLEPNAAGVIATGLSAGAAKITATGTGATELSAESDATVTLPLATTMDLVPAP